MCDIEAGDWIRIPKGTQLCRDYSKGYSNNAGMTAREVVVQVSSVSTIDFHYLRGQADPEAIKELESVRRGGCYWRRDQTQEEYEAERTKWDAKVQAAYAKVLASLPCGSTHEIRWTNDKKGVFNSLVEKVDAPAPRKKVEPKINLRQQMVNKSRWRVTRDHDVYVDITNPQLDADLQVWLKSNPEPKRTTPSHKTIMTTSGPAMLMLNDETWEKARNTWWNARRNEMERIAKLYPAKVPHVIGTLKAGTVFTISGKFGGHMSYKGEYLHGQFAPVLFDGAAKPVYMPYNGIKDAIEAESIPTVDIYVLRDTATGMFLQRYPYGNSEYVGNPLSTRDHYLPGEYVFRGMKNPPEMVDKFMKAKHFDNMGRLKTSILQATGYYDGLNTDAIDNARGYDTSYEKQMDLPDTWEVVKFDKLARKEVEVLDIQSWYKRAYELRELTLRFGSSVRSVWKALEKRGALDDQKGMIVFSVPQAQKEEGLDYGDKTAFTPEQAKSVTDLIETLGLKKGTYQTARDSYTQSLSFKDKSTALMAKLSYSGSLKMTVLDLETLREAVEG